MEPSFGCHKTKIVAARRTSGVFRSALGCVAYKIAGDFKIYHTWYSWGILRRDPQGNISAITVDPQTIPGRELFRQSAGRNYAD